MQLKQILFLVNLLVVQSKAQTNMELRSKVLNSLRAKTEMADVKVTQSDSDKVQTWRYSLSDLNPESLKIENKAESKNVELGELYKLGINADVLSYSFYNSEIPTPFGMDKKYHITYTAVKTANKDLSHFLVYYDKQNFYPVKVTYFNGNKKITTVEYLNYKKIKNKVWRAQVITSENHLSQKHTRFEITKIEINSDGSPIRIGKDKPVSNTI